MLEHEHVHATEFGKDTYPPTHSHTPSQTVPANKTQIKKNKKNKLTQAAMLPDATCPHAQLTSRKERYLIEGIRSRLD
jgi:hypothetical protein